MLFSALLVMFTLMQAPPAAAEQFGYSVPDQVQTMPMIFAGVERFERMPSAPPVEVATTYKSVNANLETLFVTQRRSQRQGLIGYERMWRQTT